MEDLMAKRAVIDEESAINLGLKNDESLKNECVIFPQRTGIPRSLLPNAPSATWMVNKFIADYVGLVPAVTLCELISYSNSFIDEYRLNDDHPFVLGESEMSRIATSVGLSLVMCKVTLNTFAEKELLVKVAWKEGMEPIKLMKQIKGDRVQRLQELEYEWYRLDYKLMDKLFFPAFA